MSQGRTMLRKEARETVAAIHRALAAGFPLEAGSGGGRTRGAYSVAAEALNISRGAMETRLRSLKRHHPDLQIDGSRFKAGAPASTPQQIDLRRAQSDAAIARSSLADAHQEIVKLQDTIADLRWASNASLAPADWTLPARRTSKSEHTPYLLTSDFQVGEVIRAAEIDHAHGYDTTIFRARYRALISTAIDLAQNHTGARWTFPGFIYARGGDAISGAIHEELAQTDDLTPLQAVQVCFEEEAAGIRHLADAFGRVEVKEVIGNHGRTTHKPQSKRAAALNYETLISYMLQREFARDKRVSFQVSESPDVFFPIYDVNVLLTHGDRIGSRGGQGFIGPVATMARGAQRVIAEQQPLGRRVDRVDMGHFHTEVYLGWLLGNGCLPGYSEYAKMNRLRPSPPSQTLLFHHPRYGVVDYRPIKLGDCNALTAPQRNASEINTKRRSDRVKPR